MGKRYLEEIRLEELRLALSLLPGDDFFASEKIVLEIGAGAGWQAKYLMESGASVLAVEVEGGKYADSRVFPVALYNGHDLPVQSEAVDLILSSNVLEHVEALDQLMLEQSRVLKRGGFCIHILPSSSWRVLTTLMHPFGLVKSLFNLIRRRRRDDKCQTSENQVPLNKEGVGRQSPGLRNLLPLRHGVKGNVLTEIYWFSRRRWMKEFVRHGWDVTRYSGSGRLYSAYSILGARLGKRQRRFLSRMFGSTCHIFVLSKPDGTIRPETEKEIAS